VKLRRSRMIGNTVTIGAWLYCPFERLQVFTSIATDHVPPSVTTVNQAALINTARKIKLGGTCIADTDVAVEY